MNGAYYGEDLVWFYLNGNVQVGPMSLSAIVALIRSGNLTRTSLVWRSGFPNWIEAGKCELYQYFQSVAPYMPPYAITNKWLWALATVPFIVVSLLVVVFGYIDLALQTLIFFCLNSLFLYLDIEELKKAKVDIENTMWLGCAFVPLYLYLRAEKTDKNYVPCIVWGILFVFDLLV